MVKLKIYLEYQRFFNFTLKEKLKVKKQNKF